MQPKNIQKKATRSVVNLDQKRHVNLMAIDIVR